MAFKKTRSDQDARGTRRVIHALKAACVLMTAGMLTAPVYASSEKADAVRVGVILNNPPYVLENPSAGIDNDIVRAAFRNAGHGVVFFHAPLSRLDGLFDDGRVEAITTFNPKRTGCVMSKPFTYWHDGIVVRRGVADKVHSVSDLKGMRVGTFPNAEQALGERLAPYIPTFAKRLTVFRTDLVVPMLERARIDAYIGDIWAIDAAFNNQLGIREAQPPYVVAKAFGPTPRWLCFHSAEMAAEFNRGLAKVKSSGEYDAIIERYHPGP